MSFKRFISIISFLTLVCLSAGAQSITLPTERSGGSFSGRKASSEKAKMLEMKVDVNKNPVGFGKFKDESLDQLNQAMDEKEWSKEETAWQKANSLGTKEAYRKYLSRYPSGLHAVMATQAVIDMEVNDIMRSSHDELPAMIRTKADEKAEYSTIVVENATKYYMTVMYSGDESKSMRIPPRGVGSITLKNGLYRIAASVPDTSVKPFAGSETFAGGRYEAGYTIVRGTE